MHLRWSAVRFDWRAVSTLLVVSSLFVARSVAAPPEAAANEPAANDTPLALDLKLLVDQQIIDMSGYWQSHAIAGQQCDGERVERLLRNLAQYLAYSYTRGAALRTLVEHKICSDLAFWDERARAGQPCDGDRVGMILRKLAARVRADLAIVDDNPRAIFVPTPPDVVEKMLEVAKISPRDVVYDLGCGDGRIVITAAVKYGCRAVGYEVAPEKVRESRDNVRRHGIEKLVRIEQQDIFTVDLREATVVALYLLPEMNLKLIPQFAGLQAGSRIVAHDYGLEGMHADQQVSIKSRQNGVPREILLYRTPLRKAP